jgi:drug/metabolite transporter (DMT)-like permease
MIAIHISPLSLTMPFLAFTPAFVMITGAVFLNESLNLWGIAGIMAIVVGAYVLHIDMKDRRIFTTISSMFKNFGSMIMLIAAFCYGFGAVFGKKAILFSSPVYMGMHFFILFNGLMTIILICSGNIRINLLLKRYPLGIIAGFAMYGEILSHCLGVSIAKVAYFVSVKRMNIIISIVYAGLFFKEENLFVRGIGAVFMVMGAMVILLFGN